MVKLPATSTFLTLHHFLPELQKLLLLVFHHQTLLLEPELLHLVVDALVFETIRVLLQKLGKDFFVVHDQRLVAPLDQPVGEPPLYKFVDVLLLLLGRLELFNFFLHLSQAHALQALLGHHSEVHFDRTLVHPNVLRLQVRQQVVVFLQRNPIFHVLQFPLLARSFEDKFGFRLETFQSLHLHFHLLVLEAFKFIVSLGGYGIRRLDHVSHAFSALPFVPVTLGLYQLLKDQIQVRNVFLGLKHLHRLLFFVQKLFVQMFIIIENVFERLPFRLFQKSQKDFQIDEKLTFDEQVSAEILLRLGLHIQRDFDSTMHQKVLRAGRVVYFFERLAAKFQKPRFIVTVLGVFLEDFF